MKNNKKIRIPCEKIAPLNKLINIVKKLRKDNKKIVTTNGVFDILHIGHIRYLKKAKELGNALIVAVNSDESVKKIKGPRRPINNEHNRAEALAALEFVDYVIIFNEENPIKLLTAIRPDIHVKGGDYKISQIIERKIVEANNGQIVLLPKVKGYSTSDLIKRIAELYKNKPKVNLNKDKPKDNQQND